MDSTSCALTGKSQFSMQSWDPIIHGNSDVGEPSPNIALHQLPARLNAKHKQSGRHPAPLESQRKWRCWRTGPSANLHTRFLLPALLIQCGMPVVLSRAAPSANRQERSKLGKRHCGCLGPANGNHDVGRLANQCDQPAAYRLESKRHEQEIGQQPYATRRATGLNNRATAPKLWARAQRAEATPPGAPSFVGGWRPARRSRQRENSTITGESANSRSRTNTSMVVTAAGCPNPERIALNSTSRGRTATWSVPISVRWSRQHPQTRHGGESGRQMQDCHLVD